MPKPRLKIIPLGGLGEIGKNMMVLEYGGDIIAVDAGLMFPQEDMLGVDLVIPDISYLIERKDRLRGIIITHGHEDHTGALPYILPRLGVPIYATKLTQGLIKVKLKEHRLLDKAKLRTVESGEEISLGKFFKVRFFHVCHSIPDATGLAIYTPVGVVVHSGDFKLDYTPVDNKPPDFGLLAQLGTEGVLLLLSDSTYVELPGYTPSEKLVGETIDHIIGEAPGRVMVTTFSSLISRIQQVIDAAAKHKRRVIVVGRSFTENIRISLELGYLVVPNGILASLEQLPHLPHNQVVLLVTGSQGEPTSAMVRIANRDYRQLHIIPGDTVIISATPIPGNEALVGRTIDKLFKQGARVLYGKLAPVHVHGHGSEEELKLMLSLVRPKFFLPIHGEYRHLSLHAKLAQSVGIPQENTFVLEDGDILELSLHGGRIAGKLALSNVYVDGLGVGDIDSVVLRDRQKLAGDGVVVAIITVDKQKGSIVGEPNIISFGLAEASEAEALMDKSRKLVISTLDTGRKHPIEWGLISIKVKDALSKLFYNETRRRPMILPVVMEV